MEGTMQVSIIMPIKDNLEVTRVAIDSIKQYTKDYQLIVIDDGSGEQTTQYLKSLPKIDYIRNEKSEGWCKAINQGIKLAQADLIVFANNDIVVTPEWFEKMEKHISNPTHNIGVLGPTSNKVEGYQHVDFNKKGITFNLTDVVTFFFVMVKRKVIDKIGGLDERFGLGGQDDADFCIRATQAGYKIGIARDIFIYHYGSATFRNNFKNDISKSSEYAKSRVDLLRNKYKNVSVDGVKKKVFIAIPNRGLIVPELASVLINWSHDPRYSLIIYMPKGLFPSDNARNHCVRKFLESDANHLLWIDDDIIPPVDALHRLIRANKDIMGAVAFAMKYENEIGFPYPVTLRYNEDRKYIVYYGKGIEECDATGSACLLFKRKVYETIERPYEFQYYRNGELALTCDFDVLQKAQKAGFHLFIDFDIICDHIKSASLKSIQDTMKNIKKT